VARRSRDGAQNKDDLLTIASEENAPGWLTRSRPISKAMELLLTLSDVQVVRPERF
jgi:hypothetical protein